MITTSRIVNASEIELVCITYEMFFEAIEKAIEAPVEARQEEIGRARAVLMVLTENLNFEAGIASDLFKLYVYVQNLLINDYQKDSKLREAYELIEMLYRGYKGLLERGIVEGHEPVIANAEHVVAGMTYGRDDVDEMVIDSKYRGFNA